jgi:hypothetical protein
VLMGELAGKRRVTAGKGTFIEHIHRIFPVTVTSLKYFSCYKLDVSFLREKGRSYQ